LDKTLGFGARMLIDIIHSLVRRQYRLRGPYILGKFPLQLTFSIRHCLLVGVRGFIFIESVVSNVTEYHNFRSFMPHAVRKVEL